MGNCLAHCGPRVGSSIRTQAGCRNHKVLQVVKTDGKVLEFTAPILVKDVLMHFPGSGIGLSKEVVELLPPNYELKAENTYYILPSLLSVVKAAATISSSKVNDTEEIHGVKRIKVVITKQELQQLLAKQVSVEDMLLGLGKTCGSLDSPRTWKPKLESIPEGHE